MLGRPARVRNRTTNALVAEYAYDERWRIVGTFRASDTSPKERFVHHTAGAGGYGTSSSVDQVVLRERDANASWTAASDGTLEERLYSCQNWRHDVVALVTANGELRERVRYTSYGIPFGKPLGDCDGDGDVDAADSANLLGAWGTNTPKCDLNLDGTINATDQSILLGNSGATSGFGELTRNRNRLGYAGYAADGESADRWHVRHRVLESKLGRWTKRDPLGYVDGTSLYGYVQARPLRATDPLGLMQIDEYNADCLMHVMGMVPPAPPGCENEWFETIADCCFYNNHDPARSLRCAQTNLRSVMRKCIQDLPPIPGTAPPPPPDHCYDECVRVGKGICDNQLWNCSVVAGAAAAVGCLVGCIRGCAIGSPVGVIPGCLAGCLAGCVAGGTTLGGPVLAWCGYQYALCALRVEVLCRWECWGEP